MKGLFLFVSVGVGKGIEFLVLVIEFLLLMYIVFGSYNGKIN